MEQQPMESYSQKKSKMLPKAQYFKLKKLCSRCWHFVIPNYTESDLVTLLPSTFSYLIQAKEIAPSTGMPHLQCFVIATKRSCTGATVKRFFPSACNITKMYSTVERSIAYCSKHDPNPTIHGKVPLCITK